jgi:hypothetical protein
MIVKNEISYQRNIGNYIIFIISLLNESAKLYDEHLWETKRMILYAEQISKAIIDRDRCDGNHCKIAGKNAIAI